MTCREFIERLLAYVDHPQGEDVADAAADGRLDEATRQLCDRHRQACVECADYLASYQTTVALARGLGAESDIDAADLPPEVVEAILRAAVGERQDSID